MIDQHVLFQEWNLVRRAWNESLEGWALPGISLLTMDNSLYLGCNQWGWTRSGGQGKVTRSEPREARTESARTMVLLFISLVHIYYKNSLELRILSPKKKENHRTSWVLRSCPGLTFSCDSFSIDHTTVIQSCNSLSLSLYLVIFPSIAWAFSVFYPYPHP